VIVTVIRTAMSQWSAQGTGRIGAALAYYSVFSLGPLLLIVTSIAGLFFGRDAVRGSLIAELRSLIGNTGAQAVEAMLVGASSEQSARSAALVGTILLLAAALGVVAQLKDAMNTIWNVPESKDAGIWWYVRTYLISLAGILGLGFLLAVSLIISAAIASLSGTSANAMMGELINFVASLAILSVLFGMLFKWFPDADVDWQDVIPGAVATALLFNIGKFAIAWYVGTQGLESTYGAAALIVILLIWVYYSAQIVLFGAELTHAYAITRRSGKSGSQITSAKR
jgi:membrane protein